MAQNDIRWQGVVHGDGGDPALPKHKESIELLAKVLARCPNSIVIRPGSASLWHMNDHSNKASAELMGILACCGACHINAIELWRTMDKRDKLYFSDTFHNRRALAKIFDTAITIADSLAALSMAHFACEEAFQRQRSLPPEPPEGAAAAG